MTPKQVAKLVGKWKRRLHLLDWTIRIDARPGTAVDEQQGFTALVGRDTRMHTAEVCIATDRSDAEVETDVVHELVHCVLHPLWAASSRATQLLGGQAREYAEAAIGDAEEIAVEALTDALIAAYATDQ